MQVRRIIARAMLAVVMLGGTSAAVSSAPNSVDAARAVSRPIRHVLLLSIDGMHAVDLARYGQEHPKSTLASLVGMGVTYTNAVTASPSDSFPGLLSIVTGGSPRSTGVWYDDSYDRQLSPPGSDCKTVGTELVYDESIDKNADALDGGGGIDPTKLALDPSKGCTPVYPHSLLRVNTIFEVLRGLGRHTAWADKHPAYDLVNGPSGKGVSDLYTPEIAAGGTTDSVAKTEAYDDLKVQAIINEIDGKDHSGTTQSVVPALFGMNFQAVSVGQKLAGNAYVDALATPSAGLLDAFNHTDASLGRMVSELRSNGLLASTMIIVTAKHGQSPIDPARRQIVDSKLIPSLVNSVQPDLAAQVTQDSVSIIWLRDASQTANVVAKLAANQQQAQIQDILAGTSLTLRFNDPKTDSRTPDIIVIPNQGVIYTKPTATKTAEHGGFSRQDTNVPILIANPGLTPSTIKSPVETTQIAPTILEALGVNPQRLKAVQMEQTVDLPNLAIRPQR
ncbi:MAG: alkaline phosphatase family protein [Herpetosiphonaceae bacterium]|nr:alkaline phosphatase family protein [Herpetosiphonaceae bacterium]